MPFLMKIPTLEILLLFFISKSYPGKVRQSFVILFLISVYWQHIISNDSFKTSSFTKSLLYWSPRQRFSVAILIIMVIRLDLRLLTLSCRFFVAFWLAFWLFSFLYSQRALLKAAFLRPIVCSASNTSEPAPTRRATMRLCSIRLVGTKKSPGQGGPLVVLVACLGRKWKRDFERSTD